MLSAGALVFFNPVWKTLFGSEFVSVKFFTDGNFPTNDIGPVMRLAAMFGAFAAFPRRSAGGGIAGCG